ncbi:hypothetical protein AZ46_0200060 [Metabacillus indicus LMG 22858]|nr:hypothetical protein AZ46_0200060 [Metabacillus indicus LMG 22858]
MSGGIFLVVLISEFGTIKRWIFCFDGTYLRDRNHQAVDFTFDALISVIGTIKLRIFCFDGTYLRDRNHQAVDFLF